MTEIATPTDYSFDEDALGEAYTKGLLAEKAGDRDSAIAAYRECLAIDPEDHCGVTVRLAAFGVVEIPESAGAAYVTTLFDQQAEQFEDILVRQLQYGVPELLAARLAEIAPSPFPRVLDLGCGTGLAAEALGSRAVEVTGVDLSENMVDICYEKDIYDRLFVAEAVSFLDREPDPAPYDLIIATDVLPYLGALEAFATKAAQRLSPGGLLAASTETLPLSEFQSRPFVVGSGQRFHHAETYLRSVLEQASFEILDFEPITVRLQEGAPAPGHMFVARLV